MSLGLLLQVSIVSKQQKTPEKPDTSVDIKMKSSVPLTLVKPGVTNFDNSEQERSKVLNQQEMRNYSFILSEAIQPFPRDYQNRIEHTKKNEIRLRKTTLMKRKY